mmetsp:Transcript_93434/g.300802  ORF Transcript_93434/g.300802 Transcript_93434/m.300802 type:complete len:88 (-) Transcript_93434:147-410(-)
MDFSSASLPAVCVCSSLVCVGSSAKEVLKITLKQHGKPFCDWGSLFCITVVVLVGLSAKFIGTLYCAVEQHAFLAFSDMGCGASVAH